MNDTKITIHSDSPIGVSSSQQGANQDAVAFNIAFIALRRPHLALQIMNLYDEASQIKKGDPQAPDEDFETAQR